MNLVLIILAALLALASAVSGGSGINSRTATPGSGSPVVVPVTAVTAAPVVASTPTPSAPTPYDQPGSGPSH